MVAVTYNEWVSDKETEDVAEEDRLHPPDCLQRTETIIYIYTTTVNKTYENWAMRKNCLSEDRK